MRRALAAAGFIFALAVLSTRAQGDEETPPIFRHAADLRLGDAFESARRTYSALSNEACETARGGVKLCRVERGAGKFPAGVETLRLSFRRGRLVAIEQGFDAKTSGTRSVEKLAGDYALDYGVPRRTGDSFFWSDGKTDLRVFARKIPVVQEKAHVVAWRTAVRISDSAR